jgi:hypothetical protein
MAETFCSNCGAGRPLGARFCATCGHPFDGADASELTVATTTAETARAATPQAAPLNTFSTNAPATAALLAGLAWLIAAALTLYLAYQQWSASQQLTGLGLGDAGLGGYAVWNAAAGIITLFFGARILTKPTPGLLLSSIVWAILNVVSGVAQVGGGATSDIFVFTIIASAAAGVLSFVARQSLPASAVASRPVSGTSIRATPSVSSPPATPTPSTTSAQIAFAGPGISPPQPAGDRSRTAERMVIALIIVAVLGGGALVLSRMQVNQTLSNVASLIPTVAPASTPIGGGVTAAPAVVNIGTGVITFGTHYDATTLLIDRPATTFKRTSSNICWSADWLREAAHSTVSEFLVRVTTGGVETTLVQEKPAISNPAFTLWANCNDFSYWTQSKAGTYKLRFLDGTVILAEGTFKLK